MRSMSRSACFISSIDSFFSYSSSFFRPQLPNMRAWRKYWLTAVSSLNSTLLRCCTTLASPFITASGDCDSTPNAAARQSAGCGLRLGGIHVTQQVARAVAAASAAGTHAELERQLVQRAGAVGCALANGLFSDCVADADVQVFASLMRVIITHSRCVRQEASA